MGRSSWGQKNESERMIALREVHENWNKNEKQRSQMSTEKKKAPPEVLGTVLWRQCNDN